MARQSPLHLVLFQEAERAKHGRPASAARICIRKACFCSQLADIVGYVINRVMIKVEAAGDDGSVP